MAASSSIRVTTILFASHMACECFVYAVCVSGFMFRNRHSFINPAWPTPMSIEAATAWRTTTKGTYAVGRQGGVEHCVTLCAQSPLQRRGQVGSPKMQRQTPDISDPSLGRGYKTVLRARDYEAVLGAHTQLRTHTQISCSAENPCSR